MIEHTNSRLWKVRWHFSVEIFTSPDGTEFRRASEATATDVIRTPRGFSVWLRAESSARLTVVEQRKTRRIVRRETARLTRRAKPQTQEQSE